MRFFFLLIVAVFLNFSLQTSFVVAQMGTGPGVQTNSNTGLGTGPTVTTGVTNLINPLGDKATLESFLMQIIALFIRIGTLVIITMIIYIGFLFVAAQGAPEKISNARTMLLWTLIGGLILLGAQAIAIGIQSTVTEISNTAPQTTR